MWIDARPIPTPTAQDFTNAVNLAVATGVRGTVIGLKWSALEPAPHSYQVQNVAAPIAYFGTGRGFEMYLGIQPINTTAKETPPDLQSVAWNDPRMELRFHQLIDALQPYLTRDVKYLSIGNEVDVYLSAHPTESASYDAFFADAERYVHSVDPWLQVGVTATFAGASGPAAASVATLTAPSDVYMLTYYPLHGDFNVNPPDAPLRDIPAMLQLAGSRPLALQEVGYPTDPSLGSSESMQATFITKVFAQWQAAGARIPFANFVLLHDLTPDVCAAVASYYGLPADAGLKAYLCSLGLRHTDGSAKAGWANFAALAPTIH